MVAASRPLEVRLVAVHLEQQGYTGSNSHAAVESARAPGRIDPMKSAVPERERGKFCAIPSLRLAPNPAPERWLRRGREAAVASRLTPLEVSSTSRPSRGVGAEPRSLNDFVDEFVRLRAQRFVEEYPHAVLMIASVSDSDPAPDFNTSILSGSQLAALRSHPAERSSTAPPPAGGEFSSGAIIPVRKRIGGVFAAQIGVGRTRNADVCLPLAQISKYHAYFTKLEDGTYTITDAGSKNGTWVDSVRVPPKSPVPVRDGSEVAFGRSRFIFYGPEAFCGLVARRASTTKFDL